MALEDLLVTLLVLILLALFAYMRYMKKSFSETVKEVKDAFSGGGEEVINLK